MRLASNVRMGWGSGLVSLNEVSVSTTLKTKVLRAKRRGHFLQRGSFRERGRSVLALFYEMVENEGLDISTSGCQGIERLVSELAGKSNGQCKAL